jgi:hypothetical protein
MLSSEKEIEVFCKYLIDIPPSEAIRTRYHEAIRILNLTLTSKEERVLSNLLKHPAVLVFVDGAFAFINPNSGIRKRLLTLSAILETDPEYVNHYLTTKDLSFPIIRFLYTGAKAVITGVMGICIIKIMRWN